MNLSAIFDNWQALAIGAGNTIAITLSALGLSASCGLIIGTMRLRPSIRFLYVPATVYVVIIRGTPLLVQLFLLFFGLPQLGIRLPAFLCGMFGLGLYSAAYVSEIVRGAIQSIDPGQMEAARSMGMSYFEAMKEIIIPQALVRMVPPLGNELVALIKNSSLVSLLTIHELMFQGNAIISVTYASLQIYLAIGAIYLVMTFVAGQGLRVTERALLKRGHLAA